MKDAYWLGVDYGVAEEAKRLGVKMNLFEAGGYTELDKQISQIEDCVAAGANAVIIGAISADGLNNLVSEIRKKDIPVIDVINGISSPDVSAKSLVSFYTMGSEAGAYLAKKHPAGSEEVEVGWFPGPAGAGWVGAANQGFLDAVKGSAVKVLEPKFGDTGKEVQLKLVEDALQANPNIRYIAGTAVTAEAAQGVIRERGLQGKVDLLSFYMTPGVYEGIKRGFILASPAELDGHPGPHCRGSGRPHPGRQGLHQACRPENLCCGSSPTSKTFRRRTSCRRMATSQSST